MKKLFLSILSVVFLFSCQNQKTQTEDATMIQSPDAPAPISLVIHGGAGTIKKENMDPQREKEIRAKLEEALNTGYAVLENGGSSTDAVVATIQVLEQSKHFNSGIGAVFTAEGKNELDASIMKGENNAAGAVAGVSTIKSPIAAARAVMEKSPHVMLAGDGAVEFANEVGLELVDPSYFFTQERYDQLKQVQEKEKTEEDKRQGMSDPIFHDYKFGTVGCVALDKNGNLTAGTSTGGMTNKKYGRVGDSPIIGAGTYADNATCGVSATGHGEFFIRNVVAYDIAALMKYQNMSLQEAANKVVMDKLVEKGGDGGIVAMDAQGNIAMPFNTPGMYRGYIKEKGKATVKIYKEN
ncbi:MAG: isoaspartyl peptidase/L-asparaginase family protein [Candidatus Cyclobacteriaceae bacterium M2_1C_046]